MLSRRKFMLAAPIVAATVVAQAQQPAAPATQPNSGFDPKWGPRGARPVSPANGADVLQPVRPASANVPRQPIARATEMQTNLPSEAGQRWIDYDISLYTARVTSTNKPEQAVLDWILRETGYEVWHSETLSFLNADRRTLHVYHTPEIQRVVSDMVDRFVNTEAESHAFNLRVVSVGGPDWRGGSFRALRPVKTQTEGTQAWLLAHEDSAKLMQDLRKRTLDFREYSPQYLLVNNGQTAIIPGQHMKQYARDVSLRPADQQRGFELVTGQVKEGFQFEFSPLLTLDGREVDAVIKCEVDQVEKMIKVNIPVPTPLTPRQQAEIQVPQLISSRLHERFRWPADQVLLISMGMGPTPAPPAGLKVPGLTSSSRAELLIFVESKGRQSAQPSNLAPGQRAASMIQNRY